MNGRKPQQQTRTDLDGPQRKRNRSPSRELQTAVADSARRLNLQEGDTVVVGISGGPDSTTLLEVLRATNARLGLGLNLQAAHLIHDFRGQEKYDDAQFVEEFCRPRGIPLAVQEVDVGAYQRSHRVSSFEQAARDLRYEFLDRVARDTGAEFVAVAHTADDLAETVLLHIARGSGMHGLRGMNEVALWPYAGRGQTPQLWRPLLSVRRSDTIEYCRSTGIEFRDDSTNYMEDFSRNRVRLRLMPDLADHLNPRVVDALCRLARTSSTQLDFLEECVNREWGEIAQEAGTTGGVVRLRRDRLLELHPALQTLVLRRAWVEATGDSKRLTEHHLQQMTHSARGEGAGQSVSLPGGYLFRVGNRWLEIHDDEIGDRCPYPEPFGDFRITLPWGPIAIAVTKRGGWQVTAEAATVREGTALDTGDPFQTYLAADALSDGATGRTWNAGDRMQPLGMTGHRKLKRLFGDARVPGEWRTRMPVVDTSRGIAWAVGVRIADWAAVDRRHDHETRAVLMTFELDPH